MVLLNKGKRRTIFVFNTNQVFDLVITLESTQFYVDKNAPILMYELKRTLRPGAREMFAINAFLLDET